MVSVVPLLELATAENLPVVGWLEKVRIDPSGIQLVAKMDTGAKHSSIRAEVLSTFKKEGQTWVRFEVWNKKGKRSVLERPLVRETLIKSRKGDYLKRPVVNLGICLGSIHKIVQVNLAPRSGFNYAMIIGRSFLREAFLVDAAAKFTIKTACPPMEIK